MAWFLSGGKCFDTSSACTQSASKTHGILSPDTCCDCINTIMSIVVTVSKTGHSTIKHSHKEMALSQQYEQNYEQQSTVNSQSTEDNHKILFRILTMNYHHSLSHTYSWLGNISLDFNIHQPSTHCKVLWNISAMFCFHWQTLINPHLPGGCSFLRTR